MAEPTTIAEYDELCNAGMKKLDEMRASGKDGSKEYLALLLEMRELTRKRLDFAGITIR